jgi:PAS domain S-box-containing protein
LRTRQPALINGLFDCHRSRVPVLRIRRLVDANIIGIVIHDFDSLILEANDAFLRMVGYDREDLVAGRLGWTDMTPLDREMQVFAVWYALALTLLSADRDRMRDFTRPVGRTLIASGYRSISAS